jgi:hypothetical protein
MGQIEYTSLAAALADVPDPVARGQRYPWSFLVTLSGRLGRRVESWSDYREIGAEHTISLWNWLDWPSE